MSYYDGTRLLSMMDINGNKPEIYMCVTNRSGGKTTYFNRLCTNKFLRDKEKFMLIYRYNYELADIADKFFKDIQGLFFKNYFMCSLPRAKGVYNELYIVPNDFADLKITDIPQQFSCGYAIALNAADQIKKYSHLFSDVDRMLFDEFQSETNHYCPNEISKFLSVHTSVARGQGKQVRYVPVYMLSNPVSLINPYFTEMEISSRLQKNTHFLKGDGFVLESGFIESASKAQKESAFNKAFSRNKYVGYAAENIYLNDNESFIARPKGRTAYIATLHYDNNDYAIREYPDLGIIYCDNKVDATAPLKISVTVEDHDVNYVMLARYKDFIVQLRYFFEKGCFRFKDLRCKQAVLTALSY